MSHAGRDARLLELEAASRALTPGPDEQATLLEALKAHAAAFEAGLPASGAYRHTGDDGRELLRHPIGDTPIPLEEALGLIARNIERLGVNCAHGGMMGYIPGGPLIHSAVADFLAAMANTFTAHSHSSPGGVRMENQVLRWMADRVGYPAESSGNLTSGGSLAQLSAFVTARTAAGLKGRDLERSVVYTTNQAHNAVPKGLRIAGLGECPRRDVPVDARHRMDAAALERLIVADRAAGLNPWLVVANAGATNTGAIDPLPEIAEVARRHGPWFHCDAAYGGFFVLCEEGRKRLAGLGASDSLILDPHKGLFIPFGTGAVLVRDGRRLAAAFGFEGDYAQDALARMEEPSPVEMGPELSRHFRGLRLWLPLQLLGTRPFAAALEEKLRLAEYAHERLSAMPGVEVGPPPDLSVVTFRLVPRRGDADDFNRRVIERIHADGRILISSTKLDGRFILRLAILSPRTHRAEVDLALEILGECATALQ